MCYFEVAINPNTAEENLQRIANKIAFSKVRYDFIVVRGMSGAVMASALAIELRKPILILRKSKDGGHGNKYEYPLGLELLDKSYIFIDDGISTGETLANVAMEMKKMFQAKMAAVFLYCQERICSYGPDIWNTKKIRYQFETVGLIPFKTTAYDVEKDGEIEFNFA